MALPMLPHATRALLRERTKAREDLAEIDRKVAARIAELVVELESSDDYADEIKAELAALEEGSVL